MKNEPKTKSNWTLKRARTAQFAQNEAKNSESEREAGKVTQSRLHDLWAYARSRVSPRGSAKSSRMLKNTSDRHPTARVRSGELLERMAMRPYVVHPRYPRIRVLCSADL